jgi:hypothetical protein
MNVEMGTAAAQLLFLDYLFEFSVLVLCSMLCSTFFCLLVLPLSDKHLYWIGPAQNDWNNENDRIGQEA